ncbi:penicillin acylase family protein [Massilia sp. 9096]|uniref:penicillin acylase family protein n=1 Tax=Massilia sp. 9096 TaxID=1500894 RepID=UPI00055B4308|nr:penicillin acylase family protein [Massilia sp. 9096]
MRRANWKVWTVRLLALIAGVLALALLGVWLFLRASLAQLEGSRRTPLVSAPVTVARDANGVPTISGASRLDLAYATGFVHGQERFFQMDLLRRSAAGELAELFGPKASPVDRAHRLHRFRARAAVILQRMTPPERAFLERYAAGVNEGLDALGARPFEYALLGAAPRAWTPSDSLLVVWAMYFDLQGNQEARELARGWLAEHTTLEQLAFLLPSGSAHDAPLDAPQLDPAASWRAAPTPAAPAWWGARTPARAPAPAPALADLAALGYGAAPADLVGSNNFTIAGTRTATGAAIVSDDMHLGLQLPNIWYRLALRFPDAKGQMRRVVGVSLPGAPPLVIVGSNGHVAWGFTNSYADTLDLVRLGVDAAHPGQVRTPAGWETPGEYDEAILVKGRAAERMVVRETSIGPIRDVGGRLYAVHWIAHAPEALNLEHLKLETAETLDDALDAAERDGIPAQNIVVGDDRGHIGWTVAGALPQRLPGTAPPSTPISPDGPELTWNGVLAPGQHPRVIDPPGGQLVTANSRQLAGHGALVLGDGGFDLGARTHQLSDGVRALNGGIGVPAAFQATLDDRALYLASWRQRLLTLLDAQALAGHPRRAQSRRLLETGWDGHASVGSVGYRLAQQYRLTLYEVLFARVNAEMGKLDPKAGMGVATSRWSDVIERLLDAQTNADAWLPAPYASWRALQLDAVDRTIAALTKDGTTLDQATWGKRNTADIAHPITLAAPFLKRWLGAPPDALPGDANMPRVAAPKFGQSERLVVSPGREEEGLFDMPGGQSGHPLSPFFLRGHEDWVKGVPTPLLPGPARTTLTFTP